MTSRSLVAIAAIVCLVGLAGAGTAPARKDSVPQCSDVYLPTLLGKMRAQMCVPPGGPSDTAQVLVHGGTYNSSYWDFGYQPQRYSYVRDAVSRGYTTFAIDKLGSGRSDHPLSALITQNALAAALHSFIGKVRSGEIGGHAYSRVITVGHSMGSTLSAIEASLYHDVDAVVLTGYSHRISPKTIVQTLLQVLYPALLDPKYRLSRDPGYLTSRPGQRDTVFYTRHDDPKVIAHDDATKDVISVTELADGVPLGFDLPTTIGITVPVLVVNGGKDAFMCDASLLGLRGDCSDDAALRAQEAPMFPRAPRMDARVIPGAGHDLTTSFRAPEFRAAVFDWIASLRR